MGETNLPKNMIDYTDCWKRVNERNKKEIPTEKLNRNKSFSKKSQLSNFKEENTCTWSSFKNSRTINSWHFLDKKDSL